MAGTIVVSTFSLVFTYICANIAALRLKTGKRLYPKFVPAIGLATSILIMLFILLATPTAWLTGVAFLLAGIAIYYSQKTQLKHKNN